MMAQPRMTFAERAAQDEKERREAAADRNNPANRTFWLEKGKERMIVILDPSVNDPDRGFYRSIHTVQGDDGHYSRVVWCLKDLGMACPVCKKTKKRGTLVAYLTILDIRDWEDSKGGKHHYSRVLLPVSSDLSKVLLEYESKAVARGKSLRGMILTMKRGTEEKSLRTGIPTVFDVEGHDTPVPWTFMSEEEIVAFANNPLVKGDDGKIFKQPGEDLYPYDYKKLFGTPDVEAINAEFGDGSTPLTGSKEDARSEWDRLQQSQEAPADDDEIPGVDASTPDYRDDTEYVDPEPVEEAPAPVARPVVRPVAGPLPRPVARPVVAAAPAAAPRPVVRPAVAPRPAVADPFAKK